MACYLICVEIIKIKWITLQKLNNHMKWLCSIRKRDILNIVISCKWAYWHSCVMEPSGNESTNTQTGYFKGSFTPHNVFDACDLS